MDCGARLARGGGKIAAHINVVIVATKQAAVNLRMAPLAQ
jgi:hypothetical protein